MRWLRRPGTVVIETSELISDGMKKYATCRLEDCASYHKVCPLKEPNVLNAKQHEREAPIIAAAGVYGAGLKLGDLLRLVGALLGQGALLVSDDARLLFIQARCLGLDTACFGPHQADARADRAQDERDKRGGDPADQRRFAPCEHAHLVKHGCRLGDDRSGILAQTRIDVMGGLCLAEITLGLRTPAVDCIFHVSHTQ